MRCRSGTPHATCTWSLPNPRFRRTCTGSRHRAFVPALAAKWSPGAAPLPPAWSGMAGWHLLGLVPPARPRRALFLPSLLCASTTPRGGFLSTPLLVTREMPGYIGADAKGAASQDRATTLALAGRGPGRTAGAWADAPWVRCRQVSPYACRPPSFSAVPRTTSILCIFMLCLGMALLPRFVAPHANMCPRRGHAMHGRLAFYCEYSWSVSLSDRFCRNINVWSPVVVVRAARAVHNCALRTGLREVNHRSEAVEKYAFLYRLGARCTYKNVVFPAQKQYSWW